MQNIIPFTYISVGQNEEKIMNYRKDVSATLTQI